MLLIDFYVLSHVFCTFFSLFEKQYYIRWFIRTDKRVFLDNYIQVTLLFLECHENLQERNKKIHLETTIMPSKCLFNYKFYLVKMFMTILDYGNIFVAFQIISLDAICTKLYAFGFSAKSKLTYIFWTRLGWNNLLQEQKECLDMI